MFQFIGLNKTTKKIYKVTFKEILSGEYRACSSNMYTKCFYFTLQNFSEIECLISMEKVFQI